MIIVNSLRVKSRGHRANGGPRGGSTLQRLSHGIWFALCLSILAIAFNPANAVAAPETTTTTAAAGATTTTPAGSTTTAPAAATTTAAPSGNNFIQNFINEKMHDFAKMVGETAASFVKTVIFDWMINSQKPTVYGSCSTTSASCWFQSQMKMISVISFSLLFPLMILAIMQGVIKGSLQQVLKTILISAPIAIVGSFLAGPLTQLLLIITDDIALVFQRLAEDEISTGVENLMNMLLVGAPSGADQHMTVATARPDNFLLLIFFAVLVIISGMAAAMVMLLRSASIYIVSLFMPLGFVMLVWPTTARYFTKLVQFLVATILSKVVMMAGLALAFSTLAAIGQLQVDQASTLQNGGTAPAAQAAEMGNGGEFSQVILFVATMLLVAFSPNTIMKFLDNFSLGEGSQLVSGHLTKPDFTSAIIFYTRAAGIVGGAKALVDNTKELVSSSKYAKQVSPEEHRARALGLEPRNTSGHFTGYELTDTDLEGVKDKSMRDELQRMSHSHDWNEVMMANVAFEAIRAGYNVDGFDKNFAKGRTGVKGKTDISGIRVSRGTGEGSERMFLYMPDANYGAKTGIIRNDPRHLSVVSQLAHERYNIDKTVYLTGNAISNPHETRAIKTMNDAASRFNAQTQDGRSVYVASRADGNLVGQMQSFSRQDTGNAATVRRREQRQQNFRAANPGSFPNAKPSNAAPKPEHGPSRKWKTFM